MADYYRATIKEMIARRGQRKTRMAHWPPQNAIAKRPPTRGAYRTRSGPGKMFNTAPVTRNLFPQLPNTGARIVPKAQGQPMAGRFNFLRGM